MPRGKSYPRYWPLAPGKWFNSVSIEDYIPLYFSEILRPLDPQKVHDDLHSLAGGAVPILLCFESPGEFCHRRLAADWLESGLGIKIPEVRFTGDQVVQILGSDQHPFLYSAKTPGVPPTFQKKP